ncbi:hypothetical protein PUN28_014004 [Cardiocondyla obscurior]|uniref:Uncharacterized protein n=1 Tax=Cardiocondyla obscurior TaxID=286306 RepID=A0AAW2F3Z4_9HYME
MNFELLHDKQDWQELSISRVFGIANTYEGGMQKLVLAEDTSHVETEDISCSELKKREKKRRCIKARKVMISFSEEEDSYLHANKENNNVTQKKKLPIIPCRQSFISNV